MRLPNALVLSLVLVSVAVSLEARPPQSKPDHDGKASTETTSGFEQRHAGELQHADLDLEYARRVAREQGLSGQKALPPGIRKNLARGKPLPPGIAKRGLPPAYVGQLPDYSGYGWQMAGSDLVLVQGGTGVIADIVRGVFD